MKDPSLGYHSFFSFPVYFEMLSCSFLSAESKKEKYDHSDLGGEIR